MLSEEERELLYSAAREIFSNTNVEEVTVKNIAEKSGIPAQKITKEFKTPEVPQLLLKLSKYNKLLRTGLQQNKAAVPPHIYQITEPLIKAISLSNIMGETLYSQAQINHQQMR